MVGHYYIHLIKMNNCECIIVHNLYVCVLQTDRKLSRRYVRKNHIGLRKKQITFLKILTTNGYTQLINKPTRVTSTTESLIDHIYTNNKNKISQSGVIESGISDHFITFCTRKNKGNIRQA
ncbi:unnamed protein product [Meganyctiphanes norvegica]|uniref:Uncharacterized protein n=1 Tax=Meganyctiphanes norvegica TaxID=48144 RepID=A0AAV2Q3H4_MEGNR